MNCLFCNIVAKKIPAGIVKENTNILVISDIQPQAPTHLLLIPLKHIATINDANPEDQALLGEMILLAADLAKERKIADDGYRLIFNVNKGGGQAIYHIHLHLLAGRQMTWPPG